MNDTYNDLPSGEVFVFSWDRVRNYVRVVDGYYRRCNEDTTIFNAFEFSHIYVHDFDVDRVPLLGYTPQ